MRTKHSTHLEIDESGLDVLNSADLVIFSRDTNSGDYNDPAEQEFWTEGIAVPMIILTPFVIRTSRWDMTPTDGILETSKDVGFRPLLALEPDHPVFAGVLDANNEADVFDEDALGTDDSIDFLDILDDDGKVGNGTVLAVDTAFEVPWLIYWEKGVEFYEGSRCTATPPAARVSITRWARMTIRIRGAKKTQPRPAIRFC